MTTPMTCPGCGAAETKQVLHMLRCRYCDRNLGVQPALHGSTPMSPAVVPFENPHPLRGKILTVALVAFSLVTTLLPPAAILTTVASHHQPQPARSPAPRPSVPRPAVLLVTRSELCFAVVGGDATPDAVVLANHDGRVTAVDGARGDSLWSSAPVGADSKIACSGDVVVVAQPDLGIRGLRASSGQEIWAAKLPDRAQLVVAGDGCFAVEMVNQRTSTIAARSGTATPCPSARPPSPSAGAVPDRTKKSRQVVAGGVQLEFSKRVPGTPMLTVKARGPGVAYQKDLNAKAVRGELFVAASDNTALVLGSDVNGDRVRLIGIESRTGAVRFDKPIAMRANGPDHLVASGAQFFLIGGSALHAISAFTGAVVWTARGS